MKYPVPYVAVCLLSCLFAASNGRCEPDVSAQMAPIPSAVSGDVMSVKDVIERAMSLSDATLDQRAALKIAEKNEEASRDWQDPELRMSYRDGELNVEDSPLDPSSTRDYNDYLVGIRLYPQNPWGRSSRISAAKAKTMAVQAKLLYTEWQVSVAVRRLCSQIHYRRGELEIGEKLESLYSDTLETAKEREEQGHATAQNVLVAARKYIEALAGREQMSRDYESARQELAMLIAVPAASMRIDIDSATLFSTNLVQKNLSSLESIVSQRRKNLVALRQEAARSLHFEERSEMIPWLEHVEVSYGGGDAAEGDSKRESSEWRVDVALSLPIFEWIGKNKGLSVRQAEYEQAESRESRVKKRTYAQFRGQLDAVRSLQKSRRRYTRETKPVLAKMQQVLKNLEGDAGLAPEELSRVHEQILKTKRLEIRSAYEYQQALLALESILGGPI
jgi:outer membrane protein TolC